MMKQRSAWQVTWSVWRAMFIREAIARLYHRRAAWAWLLFEPVVHIGFFVFIFTYLRVRTVGGIDFRVWLMVGLLGFFMFKRTMVLSMSAVAMAKPLFTYRQIKPVDAVLVRALSEGLLTLVISLIIISLAGLVGVPVWPDRLLNVLYGVFLLWLSGLGVGMLLSVPRDLIRETEDLVNMAMTPIYFLSGVMISIDTIPEPYRQVVILNPISHAIDSLRYGFDLHYQPFHELNSLYSLCYALATLLTGLALHRVYERRLIEQ